MPPEEANVTPRQPRTERGRNELGLGCGFLAVAAVLTFVMAAVFGFGQPPALALIVLVVPLAYAGTRLLKRADRSAG